jgi:EmrB/QacA subfamily drug resistance transporter
MAVAAQQPAELSQHGKWWPLVTVCVAVFMLLIDVTVVNVALPDIQSELGASFSSLQWVIDAYALTLAAFQLTAGTLGDRVGRKQVFIAGIVLFVLASLACGFAPSVRALDAFRGVQGIGGAVMFANSLAILGQTYSGRDRGTAFGVWGATTGASIAIGPLVGGALTTGVGWRWIFFVNLPIGVVALIVAWRRLGKAAPTGDREIDWVGLGLFSLALAALVFGLIRGNDAGWASGQEIGLFTGAAVGFVAFVYREYHAAATGGQPMFDVRLFRRPGFTGAQIAAFTVSGALFALFLYMTLYLQDILGFSAFQAGLRLLALTVLTVIAAPIAGKLSARVPLRLLIGSGLMVIGVGLLLMRGITATSGWLVLLPGFMVSGLGSGMTNSPLGSLAVGVVERRRSGMGAGVNNTFRQVGLATGIAAYGAIFQHRVESGLSHRLGSTLPRDRIDELAGAVSSGGVREALQHVPDRLHDAVAAAAKASFVSGLVELFAIAGVVAFVGAALCLLLIRQRDVISLNEPG